MVPNFALPEPGALGVSSLVIMRSENLKFSAFATLLVFAAPLLSLQMAMAQAASNQGVTTSAAKPQDTEVYEPVPPVVTPGANKAAPPSDAIVLFDCKNLDEWVFAKDKSPAKWTVADGILTVSKAPGSGNIETKQTFKDYQLHV